METTTAGCGPHHLRVTDFSSELIEATDQLFESYAWRGDDEAKQAKAQRWANKAAAAFGIDAPQILIRSDIPVGGDGFGLHNPASNVIVLPKMSVVSLFHFFRYAVQAQEAVTEILQPEYGGDRGAEDAAAFSTSLFHTVRPELFRIAVERSDLTVCYVRPQDLAA